jgi:hypothetical protein
MLQWYCHETKKALKYYYFEGSSFCLVYFERSRITLHNMYTVPEPWEPYQIVFCFSSKITTSASGHSFTMCAAFSKFEVWSDYWSQCTTIAYDRSFPLLTQKWLGASFQMEDSQKEDGVAESVRRWLGTHKKRSKSYSGTHLYFPSREQRWGGQTGTRPKSP